MLSFKRYIKFSFNNLSLPEKFEKNIKLFLLLIIFNLFIPPLAAQPSTSGLHYSEEELEIWRQRAMFGPYKIKGDAHHHSPAEWQRVYNSALSLLDDVAKGEVKEIWKGVWWSNDDDSALPSEPGEAGYWDGTGFVPRHAGPQPYESHKKTRNAAFVALILENSNPELAKALRDAAKKILLQQIADPNLDFSNNSLAELKEPGVQYVWRTNDHKLNVGDVGPGFPVCSMLQRMLYAYDYTKVHWTPEEKERMEQWFLKAARFWMNNVDTYLNIFFIDRKNGNYNLKARGYNTEQGKDYALHHNMYYKPSDPAGGGTMINSEGKEVPNNVSGMAIRYNNRMGNLAKFAGLAGILLDDKALKEGAKRYWKETLMFNIYPNGLSGDLERWQKPIPGTNRSAQKGLNYYYFIADHLVTLADAFARTGDFELYEFETRKGKWGTECKKGDPDKSLLMVLRGIAKLNDGTYQLYATDCPLDTGKVNLRIWDRKFSYKRGVQYKVYDYWYAQANIYYKDEYLKNAYLKTNPGGNIYPEKPQSRHMHSPYEGPWSEFPSKAFMFGQLEGKVWPYPAEP